MRLNLAAIVSASALAAAAGWAGRGGAQPAGAPSQPAAAGPGLAAPPPVPPDKSARDATPAPPAVNVMRPSARWSEIHAGLEEADTRDCLGCHEQRMVTHSHPVEVDYAEAARRAPGGFRPVEEVLARGVVLRGGKVGCPTCHSPASPWAHFLAVPRALARARSTMAEQQADSPGNVEQAKAAATPPKDGAEVSSRPLCESCHQQ